MPRKTNSDSPAPRRVSARIAATVVTKPPSTPSSAKKTTPKRSKKAAPSAKDVKVDDIIALNGVEQVSDDASVADEVPEPVVKKQKTEDVKLVLIVPESKPDEATIESIAVDVPVKDSKTKDAHEDTSEPAPLLTAKLSTPTEAISVDAAESGFEVIDKSSVPPSDSEEVKAAVSAQGEDGSLLVNFVQVSKDEVPSAEAVADISEAIVLSAEKRCDTNGITASLIPHGDSATDEIDASPKQIDDIVEDKAEAVVPPRDMPAKL